MANIYEETEDISFQIEHCIDWNQVIPLRERNFIDAKEYEKTKDSRLEMAPSNTEEAMENYKTILSAIGDIISEELLPYTQKIDSQGLTLKDGKVIFPEPMIKFIDTLRDSGLLPFAHQRKYGGYNLPFVARQPIMEMIYSADIATGIVTAYFNMAEVIEKFGSKEMQDMYLPLFGEGKILGAMALTEPNYGSDLSQIQTKAVKNEDGTFSLTGTKRFITQGCGFGEYPAAIFTVARSKNAAGAKGISFFLVETKDVEISRLEEKIGLHGSATCELVYEGSKGLLIGEEGYGLIKYAIALMNGARLTIACQSLGVAQAALNKAKKYASERIQFGTEIEKLPPVKRLLDESEAKVQASRALIYHTSVIVDYYEGNLVKKQSEGLSEKEVNKDPEVMKWDKLAKIFTPTSKLTASEFALQVASDAVQVHGGVGYTEEFEIAKIYRDARISTIYEGTSQLQSVAIIGGVVEGVSETSIVSKYVTEQLQNIRDEKVKAKLEEHWNLLKENVPKYKILEKSIRSAAAWDISWHWCYFITELLMAQQVAIVSQKGLTDLVKKKSEILKTYMMIADRQISACNTQIENYSKG